MSDYKGAALMSPTMFKARQLLADKRGRRLLALINECRA
jgi:hypothetical protein